MKDEDQLVNGIRGDCLEKNAQKREPLPATVWWMAWTALLADISSEMLYPITPLFLTAVLGASMASVGLIEGFAEALASILKIVAGSYSDRLRKRKPLVVAGYLISAISRPFVGASRVWPHVLVARSLDRFGKGIRTSPRDAWLGDEVDEARRGEAFGWLRGLDSVGACIGPLIALLFISENVEKLRSAFFWALIPGVLAALLVALCPEKPKAFVASKSASRAVALDWPFKKYLLVWLVFSLVNSSDAFLLLKVSKQGIGLSTVIFLYCFFNFVYAVLSPWLGELSDRQGRKPLLIGGFLLFASVYLGFGFATQIWQFAALFGIYGFYMAATDGVGKAYAVDLLPPEAKATGMGWLGFVTGVPAIFASTAAGWLWEHGGPAWPFIFGAVGSLCAMVLLLLFRDQK